MSERGVLNVVLLRADRRFRILFRLLRLVRVGGGLPLRQRQVVPENEKKKCYKNFTSFVGEFLSLFFLLPV
jgi:hypothetical protein